MTFAVWGAVVVASAFVTVTFLGDALTGSGDVTADTESSRADDLRFERLRPTVADFEEDVTDVVVVRADGATVDDGAFRERVEGLAEDLEAAGASTVTSYYESEDERFVSEDRDATALTVPSARTQRTT